VGSGADTHFGQPPRHRRGAFHLGHCACSRELTERVPHPPTLPGSG
jgi:hypothetical protein